MMRTLLLVGVMAIGWTGAASATVYTLSFTEVGADVVAVGSGAINTGVLESPFTPSNGSDTYIDAVSGRLSSGPIGYSPGRYFYTAAVASYVPFVFGTGTTRFPTTKAGSHVSINDFSTPGVEQFYLDIQSNYVSGNQIQSSSTFASQTFATLGLTPGTYTFDYGPASNVNQFTIQIGPAAVTNPVPEPASIALLGLGVAGIVVARRRRVE